MKKIVLITTGQPATNPRIVKEADALHAAGYEVTLLYSFFVEWAAEKDTILLQKVPWKYKMAGGAPTDKKAIYLFTRIRNKIARVLNNYFGNNFLLAERTQARAFDELLTEAKKIKADWYIGHNLGALAVAVNAAKYNSARAGFDFEDYHRGENNKAIKCETSRIVYLENKYVPQLNYISAASPLIAEKVGNHFPLQVRNIITLLNCFPLYQQPPFREKLPDDNSLQLFWFSQTIGINRGLEILLKALIKMNDPDIQLTLAGNCTGTFKRYIDVYAKKIRDRIHLAGIITPNELPSFSSKFDVGLALELSIPENRDICLTNKVFTYILAGNAIILSESTMQIKFNDQFKVGITFPVNDITLLTEKLKIYKNQSLLKRQRINNYELGQNLLNWENESKSLLKQIQSA